MKERLKFIAKALVTVYALYFVARLTFFVFQYDKFADVTLLSIIKAFFAGSLIDTVTISYSNILLVFILMLPFDFVQHPKNIIFLKTCFVLINALGLALNLIDVVYFDYSQRRTGDEILITGSNTNDLITTYLKDFWYIFILFVLYVTVLAYFTIKTKLPYSTLKTDFKSRLLAFLTFLITIGLAILGARGGFFRTPLLTQDAAKFVDAKLVALATNTPHQIISTFQTENLKQPQYINQNIAEQVFEPYIKYPSTGFNKKNVVVIILESFDKEYIGYYNQGKGYTPFLDSLITQSTSFTHSYACGTTSIECPPAIFSSIPSLMSDSYINSQYNVNRLSGLGDILAKEGYETGFYHGSENGTMNFDAFIGVTNFGKYYGLMQYPNPQQSDGHWGIPDEPYLQYFAQQLDDSPQPFCKAVFTLSSHHPYLVPDAYKDVLPNGTLPIHKAIAYSDLSLRKFFDRIKKSAWYKNTLFIITADHTSITDNNAYRNYYGDYSVPILFFEEGTKAQAIPNKVVQHKDIMPSVLFRLGYDKKFFSLGSNIFDPAQRTFSITYRNGHYYYFTWPYMLTSNTIDPPNVENLTAGSVSQATNDSLDRAFKSYLQIYQSRMISNKLF